MSRNQINLACSGFPQCGDIYTVPSARGPVSRVFLKAVHVVPPPPFISYLVSSAVEILQQYTELDGGEGVRVYMRLCTTSEYSEVLEGKATCRLHRKSPHEYLRKTHVGVHRSHTLVSGHWTDSQQNGFQISCYKDDMSTSFYPLQMSQYSIQTKILSKILFFNNQFNKIPFKLQSISISHHYSWPLSIFLKSKLIFNINIYTYYGVFRWIYLNQPSCLIIQHSVSIIQLQLFTGLF